jgi:hypothetical protein
MIRDDHFKPLARYGSFLRARSLAACSAELHYHLGQDLASRTMSKALTEKCMALLKGASEMFEETGCVPGIDGEQVPAERIVPDAKEYISETIDDPQTVYDPKIWDTPGFALVLSWNRRYQKLAPRGSKNPEQYLTKEQQKACLDSAAAELVREITHGRSLN